MAVGRDTLMDPPIEELLDKVDSKFTLVAVGARRARQVNAYYNSLGEGMGRIVPPQVTSLSGKPLSIALEEIAAGKVVYTRREPGQAPVDEVGDEVGEEAVPGASGEEPAPFDDLAGQGPAGGVAAWPAAVDAAEPSGVDEGPVAG
ncbi:MAG TPA: DNA-directed RNA polymerase subunit omega [Acidimicrobiales bacterium]|nr:DNA-directed RNA polymerase subunit omega [Acidimicrobiales bacterium]